MFPETPLWQPAPDSLRVDAGEIHIWRISLDRDDGRSEQLAAHLDEDELRRARRFVQSRHRRRFTTGRGALREIVAAYLGEHASALRFRYGPHGKPRLAPGTAPLAFNLAHSDGLALCAVCLDGEIGVDLEHLRPIGRAQGIAESYFSPRESRHLAELQGAESQTTTFFHLWTCKEAYLKACGKGLSKPLREVEVSLPRDAEPRYERIGGAHAGDWTLRTFVPESDFLGAVAVERAVREIRFWLAP